MALKILSSPSSAEAAEEVATRMREAIEQALPGAAVRVAAVSPGHFEVEVESAEFEGLARVRQQQRVYAAIAPFMKGDAPPVHAIDRLLTRVP